MSEIIKKESFSVTNIINDLGEELSGLTVDFSRVKIPSGGGLSFEVITDDPDNPEMVKELEGVIVYNHPVNAYWKEKYAGGNVSPDCYAADGETGVGEPGGQCSLCPMNQFGSDGKGKACKNMRHIYLLRQGEAFPLLLVLPPTSIKNLSNYIYKSLVNKGLQPSDVVTKITLKRVQNSTGINYSQAVFKLASELDDETKQAMAKYKYNLKAMIKRQQTEIDTIDTEDTPF